MPFYDQSEYMIRCEWGYQGLQALLPSSEIIIIVDVMSFCTCVDVAVSRGAIIYPYKGEDAPGYASEQKAELARFQRTSGAEGYSLSPTSLTAIPSGTRLVLPSPNGSTLSLATGDVPTFAGCLRNAGAVAAAATQIAKQITVIPAGEKWEDGSLRPALEDWIGAGAIIHALRGTRSPEAQAAEHAFLSLHDDLSQLGNCSSARELIERGFSSDVDLALALNVSQAAPRLIDSGYRHAAATS